MDPDFRFLDSYKQNWFRRTKILLLVLFAYNIYLCLQFLTTIWAWLLTNLDGRFALLLGMLYVSPPVLSMYAYLTSERRIHSLLRNSRPAIGILRNIFDECRSLLRVTTPAQLWVNPSSNFDAFAFGNRSLGTVVITQGLIDQLSEDELKGILSHELAHIKSGDHSIMTWTNSLVRVYKKFLPAFLILSSLAIQVDFEIGVGNPVWLAVHTLTTTAMIFIVPTLVVNSLSRAREQIADLAALSVTRRYPVALIKSAPKSRPLIGNERLSLLPAPSMKDHAHSFHRLLQTHPPIKDRVRSMREGIAPSFHQTRDCAIIGGTVAITTILSNEVVLSSILSVFALVPSAFPLSQQTAIRIWLALVLARSFEKSIYIVEIIVPAVVLFLILPVSNGDSIGRSVTRLLAVCAGLIGVPVFYLLPEQAVSLGVFPIPKRTWPTVASPLSASLYAAFGYYCALCMICAVEWIIVTVVKANFHRNRNS